MQSADTPARDPQRVGLVAGGGRFPVVVAEALRRRGIEVVCAALRGQASPELARVCEVHRSFALARLGSLFRYFRQHDVRSVTWAGWIRKEEIFRRWRIFTLLPDWRMIRFFFFRLRNRQNQTILATLADEFESAGFHLTHSTQFNPELLVAEGLHSRRRPSAKQIEDIRFGWTVARRMADLDVGQSVAVCEQSTLAVEGIEGTDRNIRRAGEFYPRGGFTVIKLAKTEHDMRFDVPTVGPATIESLKAAGGAVLCLEAGRTMMIDRERALELADKLRIVVLALSELDALDRVLAT